MKMQYDNLKAHIKSKIGTNKFYDAVPLMNLPPPKKTLKHHNINAEYKTRLWQIQINLTKKIGPKRPTLPCKLAIKNQ